MAMRDGARSDWTVADYLLARLKALGVDDALRRPRRLQPGIPEPRPGSNVRYVGTCNELNAAYAADGYARLRGHGGLCDHLRGRRAEAPERRGRGVRRAGAGSGHHRCAGHGAFQIAHALAPHARRLPDPLEDLRPHHRRVDDARATEHRPRRRSTECSRPARSTSSLSTFACPPMSSACRARAGPVTAPTAALERPGDAPGGARRGSGHAGKAERPVVIGDVELIRFGLSRTSSPTSSSEPVCPTPR